MFDWVPVVFLTFKLLIFGTCMYLAIKWHYDQGKKKGMDQRTLLRSALKMGVGYVVAVLTVLLLTYALATHLGMDLSMP